MGRKHLIQGNHDAKGAAKLDGWTSMTEEHGSKVIYVPYNGYKLMVILSHYAYAVWNKSHHGSINLYGHSHGKPPNVGIPNNQQLDVGVDAWNGYPCNIDMIMKKLATLPAYRSTDHHQAFRD